MSAKTCSYKYCIVPGCGNSTVSAPYKTFITLPKDVKTRRVWQDAMHRSEYIANNSVKFCCEDHFDLEQDMENYMHYKMMENVKIKIKEGVVPHIFDCQRNDARFDDHSGYTLRKRKCRFASVDACKSVKTSPQSDREKQDRVEVDDGFEHKSTQVNLKTLRVVQASKKIQCELTRPVEKSKNNSDATLQSTAHRLSGATLDDMEKKATCTIEKNPKVHLGIPKKSFYIIQLLSTATRLRTIEIFVTLKKIKMNSPYSMLAADFGLTVSQVTTILQKSLPILATYFKSLIQWKNLSEIHRPKSFKLKYAKVQSIIDCFEIAIRKPNDPTMYSLSWSERKKCNTMKYLISYSPGGLITFLSEGFGGRTTDKMVVEKSGLLELLENASHVMAVRGFKNVEELFSEQNNVLAKPLSSLANPNTPSTSKPSPFGINSKRAKEKLKEAAIKQSLRDQIGRIIYKINEFGIFEPDANVDSSLIEHLDCMVIIACGIINLQNYLTSS